MSVGAISSPICSATRQPNGTFSLCSAPSSGLGLVQERDDDGLRARLVDVHLQGVADVGGEALGVAGVDQVLARADHDLAEPGQLADQVGPLLDDLLAADGLDHHPAADLHGHAQAVAADQPLAVVGDRVGRLLQVERAVDLVGEPLELVPEPLLRHHLPHLAVLEVVAGQVAEVADEPQRALLRAPPGGSGSIRISSRPTTCLSTISGAMISAKLVGLPALRHPLDRRARAG